MNHMEREQLGGRQPHRARANWLSAVLLFWPLALLAEVLIRYTHHRPLGAATFATLAVLLWILAEVTSRRLLDPKVCARRAQGRKVVWVMSGALSLIVFIRGFV